MIKKIEELAEILKKYDLSEIGYKYKDEEFRLVACCVEKHDFVDRSVFDRDNLDRPGELAVSYNEHEGALKSPMVGTCYLASGPGERNFVSLGDVVQKDQPLLIIEAMKVMNIIRSPKPGKIVYIAVSNADPIEFGQLLLVIE